MNVKLGHRSWRSSACRMPRGRRVYLVGVAFHDQSSPRLDASGRILGLTTQADWMWSAIFVGAAIVGKVASVYVTARLSGFSSNESAAMGVLMNTRGLVELIVLNIGLDLGFIPQHVFTMLMIMALVTTLMTAPLLRITLPRVERRFVPGVACGTTAACTGVPCLGLAWLSGIGSNHRFRCSRR